MKKISIIKEDIPRQLNFDSWATAYKKAKGLIIDQIAERGLISDEKPDTIILRQARSIMIRDNEFSWTTLRDRVWKRDKEICQVCLRKIPYSNYQCGHIIDRVCGGSDRLSNLVVMCCACNQGKPMTQTRSEYLDWVKWVRHA